jgi:hypothetical protein
MEEITKIFTRLQQSPKESATMAALREQLKSYLEEINKDKRFLTEDMHFLGSYLDELMAERNVRAMDVESPEIHEVDEIADSLFPLPPYAYICIDGRVTLTHEFGMVAKMKGGSIELPGGNPREFVPARNGGLVLRLNSNTSKQLKRAFMQDDEIAEILDSHLACAAQEAGQASQGEPVADHGLLADVKHKANIAKALLAHCQKHHAGKKVYPIQLSFDPHGGYLFMGLESSHALAAGEKAGGFTDDVLKKLAEEGIIISTEHFCKDKEVSAAFAKEYAKFKPAHDWINYYKETALQFWKGIQALKSECLHKLISLLISKNGPYAGMDEEDKAIRERALLLLTNAFSGYCNNKDKHYAFGHHNESFVSVTERDFRPCHKTGFVVYSLDLDTMADSVVFASTIVRKNRGGGAVALDSNYKSAEIFAGAPVPVIVKEIVRDEEAIKELASLRNINWSFLGEVDWMSMNNDEFIDEIKLHNPHLRIEVSSAQAINRLRMKMAALNECGMQSAEQLISGKLFALPVIADKSRRFKTIIPFFVRGYSEK